MSAFNIIIENAYLNMQTHSTSRVYKFLKNTKLYNGQKYIYFKPSIYHIERSNLEQNNKKVKKNELLG